MSEQEDPVLDLLEREMFEALQCYRESIEHIKAEAVAALENLEMAYGKVIYDIAKRKGKDDNE